MVESSQPVSNDDIARHYDQLDRFYREIWGEHVHHGVWETGRESPDEATRRLIDLVVERTRLAPGMKVLDLGCGYGGTARVLADEQGALVTGLTLSTAQKRYADSLVPEGAGNPRYLIEDWLANQQPSGEYDALVALESTEHMPEKGRVFAEAARVLKPGGRLVVCVWLAGEDLRPWERDYLIEPVCREGRLPALGTEREHLAWIRDAGFEVFDALDVSEQVSRTWPICIWRMCLGLLRKPSYLRFILDAKNDNRIFALTMIRIWLAYRRGAMRYVVFGAVKKPAKQGS